MSSYLKLIFLCGVFFQNAYCAQKVRGVAPERASLYDASKPFQCLDGSSVIPFSQVNDDYCDCRDGSDEPGTAACLNGSFACENLGYIVQLIPSSRVNDGICDCCDGSDEYSGRVTCPNTCSVLAAKMREEEEKLKKLKEEGFAKRRELIEEAARLKKALQDQVQELEAKKAQLLEEKNKLEEKKTALEQKAKEAKDKQDQIALEKQREIDAINLAKKVKELFDLLDINKDSQIQPNELVIYRELDVIFDNDGSFTLEEAQKLLDENPSIDFVQFETIYYDKISPHLKLPSETQETVPSEPEKSETQESVEESDHEHEHDHEHDHDHDHDQDHDHDHDHYQDNQATTQTKESKYDAETQALIDEADSARRVYEESNRNYHNVESDLVGAQRKLGLDTGPNNEFSPMIDQCYEFEDREYIYKLCPFEKTVQKSKANSGETIIGNWKSWGDDERTKYSTMKFDNGLACWNGPQRSTNVIVSCGLENKITSVSEPNRCEYEMKFETPAVCDDGSSNQTGHVHDDL